MSRSTAANGESRSAPTPQVLEFYSRPEGMSEAGRHAALLRELPRDPARLAQIVQGLVLHEYVASSYGVRVPDERRRESHVRRLEQMLDELLALDDRPLAVARPPERRLVGVCHHFALLFVGMLRAHGIPARFRCGFGSFFNPPFFEEHVLGECWNAAEQRWTRIDPQLDEVWRRDPKIDFDPMDVPRDRFVIAADAWEQCRAGAADPDKFGIFVGGLRGLWFIAAELVRDLAALNNAEMLPWDTWGAMPRPGETLTHDQLAFFDHLAALTRAPEAAFAELRESYRQDDRLRVPSAVHNAVLNRMEAV
jgi:hypothetical protein